MEEKKQRPQDKWNEKNGLISKSYKLNKDIVDAFADACKTAGVSQKAQLEKMMREFIERPEDERKVYLVYNDSADDCADIHGYCDNEEDADRYCDAHNANAEYHWEEIYWEELEHLNPNRKSQGR